MKMVLPQWQPLAALAAFILLHVPAAGLNLRAGPAPAPAPGPAGAPGPAPGPAPPPIRPGVVVQITKNKAKLVNDFGAVKGIRYVPMMDEMLGKTFVVRDMKYGGAGIPSPNGSQDDTWYFPITSLTPWLDTPAGKEVPVPNRAFKAVGLPTRTKLDIGPPGRHDAPWEYTIKGRNLMDPIAPPHNERVDLEKTSMPMPPWRKVKQVVSIECMEKLHKDPSVLCKPEAYVNYNLVTPKPTTQKPLTEAEAKVLRQKIKRLQTTVDNLTPKAARTKVKLSFKFPGIANTNSTLNSAGDESNRKKESDSAGKKMKVGAEAANETLPEAGGQVHKTLAEPCAQKGQEPPVEVKLK